MTIGAMQACHRVWLQVGFVESSHSATSCAHNGEHSDAAGQFDDSSVRLLRDQIDGPTSLAYNTNRDRHG